VTLVVAKKQRNEKFNNIRDYGLSTDKPFCL